MVGRYLHFIFSQQDKRKMGSAQTFSFLVLLRIIISLISLCGLFFLSGFFRKDIIYEIFTKSKSNIFLFFIFVIRLLFTFFYRFRLFNSIILINQNNIFYLKISKIFYLSFVLLTIFRVLFSSLYISNFCFIPFFFSKEEKYFLLVLICLFLFLNYSIVIIKNLLAPSTILFLDFLTFSFSSLNFKQNKIVEKYLFEKFNLYLITEIKSFLFREKMVLFMFILLF